eukprot:scaffold28145_cov98-Isochrysis_galbana.AAC.4
MGGGTAQQPRAADVGSIKINARPCQCQAQPTTYDAQESSGDGEWRGPCPMPHLQLLLRGGLLCRRTKT